MTPSDSTFPGPEEREIDRLRADFANCADVGRRLEARLSAVLAERDALALRLAAETERCAKVAEAQPFFPDTITGKRQQWVKDQIAAAIRASTPGGGK